MLAAASMIAILVLSRYHHNVIFFDTIADFGLQKQIAEDDISTQKANSTLGFGEFYVVSGFNSLRQIHLREAAAVTRVGPIIPEQKEWTEDDIRDVIISDSEKPRVGTVSVKAWLGHDLVL